MSLGGLQGEPGEPAGEKESDVCWFCDPWKSDEDPEDFSQVYAELTLLSFQCDLIPYKAEWRNLRSSARVWLKSLAWTSRNACRVFSFTPFQHCFGQRCTNWTDHSSHRIACAHWSEESFTDKAKHSAFCKHRKCSSRWIATSKPAFFPTGSPPSIRRRPAIWRPSWRSDT